MTIYVRNGRRLVPANDRDRISAARYAVEKLTVRLNQIAIKRRLVWMHYCDSAGGIRSESA